MLADREENMVIAFIAPHERISIAAQSIVEASGYPAKIYLGDLQQGVRAARQAMAEGAKIFISRGGTARLIRQGSRGDPLRNSSFRRAPVEPTVRDT